MNNLTTSKNEQELAIQYGSAAAEAMFDFPCHFFKLPDCIGLIAYRLEYNCAIILGDPICPPEEIFKLTEAFHRDCQEKKMNIIYAIVSEKFADWLKSTDCHISIEVCEEYIYNPQIDPNEGSRSGKHRIQKALKHGLVVHEYIPKDIEIENTLISIGKKWEQAIKGPHIYLGHLNFFESYEGKRWFYVKDGNQITAMAMLSRIEVSEGWLLKFLVSLPGVFHDTSFFLMNSVLETLKNENCHFLSKGMIPLNSLGEVKGFGYFSEHIIRSVYKLISWICKFNKRKEYWLKYKPKALPTYLVFLHSHVGLNEIRALIKAFKTNR